MMTTFCSRMRSHAVWSLALVVVAFRADVSLQTPSSAMPQVRILSPREDAFVSGPTRLQAGVEPPNVVSRVVFYVDGRQVCSATKPPFECDWDAGATIAAHQVRLAVYLTTGGRLVQNTRTRGIGFAETVDVDVVQVTVAVLDEHGHHVKGLPKSAFHVAEDGRPQAISHFYSEDMPLELMVAVDISGSMTQAMPTVRRAVSKFLGAVPSRDRVTLLGFNDDVFTLTRKTTDPAERMRAVDGLAAWGSTVLYDVIVQGAEMLGPQTGRKALVVFTDGDDQGSHVTVAEVEQRLQASDVTLYMIGQGRGVTSEPLKRSMDRLSRSTGGRAFFTDSIDELGNAFNELLEELSNQYVLGYQPTNTARDNTWRGIKVDVDGHRRIRARQGYRIQNLEFGIRN
jgi:Ca-activated chloride channel family protein